MSAGARWASLPGPFVAMYRHALRVGVPPRRKAVLLLPCTGAVLFGVLARALEEPTPERAFNEVSAGLFGLVLPLVCLLVGDAVLGAEVRSGAFTFTWLSPARFSTIVLARWLAGWTLAAATLVPAMAAAGIVAEVPSATGPLAITAVSASCAYIAIFVALGAAVQRSALWALAAVLVGERLLGGALSGFAQLSPQWLARSVYAGLGPDADELVRQGVPSGAGAVGRLALITTVFLVLAANRMRTMRPAGASGD